MMKFLDLAEVETFIFIVVVGVHHHAAALARGGEFGALGSFLGARVLLIAALLSISNKVSVGSGLKLLVVGVLVAALLGDRDSCLESGDLQKDAVHVVANASLGVEGDSF